jgi:phosphatidylinositol glycan class A protein
VLTHAVSEDNPAESSTTPNKRFGVRWMTNGLKVYYMPLNSVISGVTYPSFVGNFALFRTICLRERIEIVHGHQATSTLMHECLFQAKTMGFLKTMYTDHSLFGFADAASVHLNKVMKFSLSTIDHAICVSHTCKENLVLRASLSPEIVSTIPNAVDTSKFKPKERAIDTATHKNRNIDDVEQINVIILSRLVYRKGIDLVGKAIQLVCESCPKVSFIVGGDGPKRLLLEEMREKHRLHDRVHLIGAVPHDHVRDVLCQGHIFLNSSLTESFCIAILEAAACGLFVVSTRVGGIPEVLPPDMIQFAADTTPEALAEALLEAIPRIKHINHQEFHERIAHMYNWYDVAVRTEKIYAQVMTRPFPSALTKLQLYYSVGPVAGIFACMMASIMHLFLYVLEYIHPSSSIEEALEFPSNSQKQNDQEKSDA